MAQFQIPQFIEEESKLVGPFSLKQFIYIGVAGGISFMLFYVFTFFLWILCSIIIVGFALALALVKINGQDLISVLTSGFAFMWKPRRYTWQRAMQQTTLDLADLEKLQAMRQNISIQDKIKNIALRVTTGKAFSPSNSGQGTQKERFEIVSYLTGEQKVAKRIDY